MLPAWWSGKADKQKQNRRSARQERERARQVGGRTTAGSGSSWRSPEDVRTPFDEDERGFLESLKYTDAASFTIKIGEWKRLRKHAFRSGREPRLVIDFPEYQLRLVVHEESYPDRGA